MSRPFQNVFTVCYNNSMYKFTHSVRSLTLIHTYKPVTTIFHDSNMQILYLDIQLYSNGSEYNIDQKIQIDTPL